MATSSSDKLSIDDYLVALEKMKSSPNDRIGVLGELGVTGLGVTSGLALSGTAAAAAGASTLAGSTALASMLGSVFVTSTPVGWVVGAAMLGGFTAYGVGKLIRSGSRCDVRKKLTISELEKRVQQLKNENLNLKDKDKKIASVITAIKLLVVGKQISQNKGTEILVAIENNSLDADEAFNLLQNLINSKYVGVNVFHEPQQPYLEYATGC